MGFKGIGHKEIVGSANSESVWWKLVDEQVLTPFPIHTHTHQQTQAKKKNKEAGLPTLDNLSPL
jgi:hypothetical protein